MKTIKDSVHDHIEVEGAALDLLDTPAVQRLRHVKQLDRPELFHVPEPLDGGRIEQIEGGVLDRDVVVDAVLDRLHHSGVVARTYKKTAGDTPGRAAAEPAHF